MKLCASYGAFFKNPVIFYWKQWFSQRRALQLMFGFSNFPTFLIRKPFSFSADRILRILIRIPLFLYVYAGSLNQFRAPIYMSSVIILFLFSFDFAEFPPSLPRSWPLALKRHVKEMITIFIYHYVIYVLVLCMAVNEGNWVKSHEKNEK